MTLASQDILTMVLIISYNGENSEVMPRKEDKDMMDSSENEMTLEVELASSDIHDKVESIDHEESEMEKEVKFFDNESANLSAMNNEGKGSTLLKKAVKWHV